MRYRLTPIKIANLKNTEFEEASVEEVAERRESLCAVGGKGNWCSHCEKQSRFHKKLKIEQMCDLEISLPDIHSKEQNH